MTRDEVLQWVAGYVEAWRGADLDAVAGLFTEDAHYRSSPNDPPRIGVGAIRDFWLDDEGTDFTVNYDTVAVEDRTAVVRLEVSYRGDEPQDYQDLWLLRFGPDDRVEDFEEWYWSGRPDSVPAED